MILVEFVQGNYWRVIALCINANVYRLKENQKMINDYNWIEGKTKHDLIWDDNLKQVIDFPIALKVAIYKKQKLSEYKEKLIQHIGFIEAGADKTTLYNQLKTIITIVKNANTVSDIDTACSQIDQKINSVLSDIGFDATK